ncbi:AI-2E family transporter [Sphingobium lignivorans]|uniref:AI-2 transport protein TqsA n=1 Tax=Sphingobium lignivorans TaxID=2735886 RepID=A0ABR6NCB1_9SPHN|nr:AI-2E family transporter [Sphingobium lignivorans]MBB5984903.1 AI-2 transport protein TqsA [Sphingobium lignivorans]
MALPTRNALLALIAVLVVAWTLRATAMVAVPVVAALLAALAVAPLARRISRAVPPSLGWLGPLAATGLVLALIVALGAGLSIAGGQIVSMAPAVAERTKQLAQSGGDILLGASIMEPQQLQGLAARLMEPAFAITQGLLGTTATIVSGLVLILFLVLLMLLEGPVWRQKMEAIGGDGAWLGAIEQAGAQLRRFLLVRLLLGAVTGALYALWLSFFGVDLLLTWGLLALLLNFIPTIGSIIAGALPAAYVAITRDVGTALVIGAGLLVIEQIMGNYVDPRVMGKQMALSSLVVLVSLLVWTWAWGAAGTLLATPLTALLVDLCRVVPTLRPVALLMSSDAKVER